MFKRKAFEDSFGEAESREIAAAFGASCEGWECNTKAEIETMKARAGTIALKKMRIVEVGPCLGRTVAKYIFCSRAIKILWAVLHIVNRFCDSALR